MVKEFDLNKIYHAIWSKKKLLKWIKVSLDKEFQIILLPTSKNSADILIRDVK